MTKKVRSKTVKVLVPRSDNTRAQRVNLILIGIMLWLGGIRSLLVIQQLVYRLIDNPDKHKLDPVSAGLEIAIFVGYVIGLYGILKVSPPLHYFVIFSAILSLTVSLILTYFNEYPSVDLFFAAPILYINLRFPIRFEYEKQKLELFRNVPLDKIK